MVNPEMRWLESSSARFALRWLTNSSEPDNRKKVLKRAKTMGLIKSPNNRVEGRKLTALVRRRLEALPSDSQELGILLCGLGNMGARSHAEIIELLAQKLSIKRHHRDWKTVLTSALDTDIKPDALELDAIGLCQWIKGTTLKWETYNVANAYCDRAPILNGLYGLRFASEIAMRSNIEAVDSLVKRSKDKFLLVGIASRSLDSMSHWRGLKLAIALLKSKVPAMLCIGASVAMNKGAVHSGSKSLKEYHRLFTGCGVSHSDSIWILASLLKNQIHARYRLSGRVDEERLSIANLKSINEDIQNKGSQHQIQHHEDQLLELIHHLDKVEINIESLLTDMAELWPTPGLSADQMQSLEYCFVDTSEFRFRLAEKNIHQDNTKTLLTTNIAKLEKFGLCKENQVGHISPPHPQYEEFGREAIWAAKSLLLMHKGSAGHQTAKLLYPVYKEILSRLKQPFAVALNPTFTNNVLLSTAYAYMFAFIVVGIGGETNKDAVHTLRQQVMKNTKELLESDIAVAYLPGQFVLELSANLVHSLTTDSPDKATIKAHVQNVRLPAICRALSIWSAPDIAAADLTLASQLFYQSAEYNPNREPHTQLNQLLSLADLAVATSAKAEQIALTNKVIEIWDNIVKSPMQIPEPWKNFPKKLSSAIQAEGAERCWLLSEPSLKNAASKIFLETQAPA